MIEQPEAKCDVYQVVFSAKAKKYLGRGGTVDTVLPFSTIFA